MYILRLVLETKSRQMMWIQYLIVALRTLALAALVMAFLSPHTAWKPPTQGAFPPAPPSTHRLVLLDTSASMQARFENGTSQDAVISLCRKIIHAGRSPGRLELHALSGRDAAFVIDAFPVGSTRLEQVLATLQQSHDLDFLEFTGRVAAVLAAAYGDRKTHV